MTGIITKMESAPSEEQTRTRFHPLFDKWFYNKFKALSEAQTFSIPCIHNRENVLISSPTGSGKTLSAFGAILSELIGLSEKNILEDRVYAVYISPLKALNNDIGTNLLEPLKEIQKLAEKELGIRVAVRTGDTTPYEKSKMTKNPPHILITTPESLGIILASTKFSQALTKVEWLIIDEIHSLAENKRGTHLSLSVERLAYLSNHMCRVGLSATVAPIDEVARFLVGTEGDCKVVDVNFLKNMDLKVLSPVDDLIETSGEKLNHELYKLLDDLIQSHKTTLIFTNTRAATERVVHYMKEKFPKNYSENIGAHHGSLSKEHRFDIEQRLREGKLKCVVCSTSLELGIDIGFIDLVILLSSPKSVARALQRIGRSGHQLHSTTKGRLIAMNRDDLIECSVLLKSAIDKKIDRIHIPKNALDVLVQHVHGLALQEPIHIKKVYEIVTKSYCYRDLTFKDFKEVVDYLAGNFVSLEDRYIYAKIYFDKETQMIGKKGKLSRVIHMTNMGTIPDSSGILVKIGEKTIGMIDEGFMEKLKRNDIFVLGGNTYQFRFGRGMTAQVVDAHGKKPTVPSWFSEMLPLSFDLATDIGKFRNLMEERFLNKKSKEEIIKFINEYLYVDEKAALAIYRYFKEQFDYVHTIPSNNKIIIEHYTDEETNRKYIVFHTLFGRRVNDCLSRAMAYVISKTQHRDVEIGISDNGFYLVPHRTINAKRAFDILRNENLYKLMSIAIDKTEILKRRFRQCAGRALMILRNYKGRQKRVGRQQVSSMILMSAVKRVSEDFFLLKETRREVLEDLMDIQNTQLILKRIQNTGIKIEEIRTIIPSPFAFNLVLMGHLDIMKMEERVDFLKRMHQHVLGKIAIDMAKKGNKEEALDAQKRADAIDFSYEKHWEEEEEIQEVHQLNEQEQLIDDFSKAARRVHLDPQVTYDVIRIIEGDRQGMRPETLRWIEYLLEGAIPKIWTDNFIKLMRHAVEEIK